MKLKEVGPKYLTGIVLLAIVLLQIIFVYKGKNFNIAFGVEYGNIAKSMLAGKGFGNPFYPSLTGPTAWMPPFLVYLIYAAFLWFGEYSTGAFIFLTVIKIASYGLTFYFLLKTLQLAKIPVYPLVLVLLFLLYFLFSPWDNLSNIHDFWIIQLLVALFLYATLKIYYGNTRYFILQGIVIFLAPFNNPGYSLAFMFAAFLIMYVIPTFSIYKQKRTLQVSDVFRRDLLLFLMLCLIFAGSVSLWTIRNYQTFGKFMPTKSNMWFEFYLSNIVDADGQLSQSTGFKAHPIYNKNLREEMLREGEAEWLAKYEEVGKQFLSSNTSKYFQNVWTRTFNAFVFIENDNDRIFSPVLEKLNDSDRQKLQANKLIHKNFWVSLSYSQEEFREILKTIGVGNINVLLEDWTRAKQKYIDKKYSLRYMTRSIGMALIPFLFILLLLITRKYRQNPAIIMVVSMYFVYLLPYLLISHQIRYQRPLFLLQVILVYVALTWFLGKIPGIKRRFPNTG